MANLTKEEQESLAEYWFRLNFVPFEGDVGGAGYGVPSAGPGGYAPGNMLPATYLIIEFGDVLAKPAIEDLAVRLGREATWWIPVPADDSSSPTDDPAAAAWAALDLVEVDLVRVGPGHNQGPPLDPAMVAKIREEVQAAKRAVSDGAAGKEAASSAASGLITIAGLIGSAFIQGVAKKAGEDAEPLIKHGLAVLLDHVLQAATALLHWIASISSGPLL